MIIEDRFIRRYSDAGMYIRKVGTEELYDMAIDLLDSPFEYEETDIPIESVDEENEEGVNE